MKQLRVYNYPIDDSEAISLMLLYHTCESNDCLDDDVANLADFFNALRLNSSFDFSKLKTSDCSSYTLSYTELCALRAIFRFFIDRLGNVLSPDLKDLFDYVCTHTTIKDYESSFKKFLL